MAELGARRWGTMEVSVPFISPFHRSGGNGLDSEEEATEETVSRREEETVVGYYEEEATRSMMRALNTDLGSRLVDGC